MHVWDRVSSESVQPVLWVRVCLFTSDIDVIIIDQQYRDKLFKYILFEFMLNIEIEKFIDLMIDDSPSRWIDKIN